MGEEGAKKSGGGMIAAIAALAIPAAISALVLGIAAFSGAQSGRTEQQPADASNARIAKTISILTARIDTCAVIKDHLPAIEEAMANLNILPQDLAEKKASDGKPRFTGNQIEEVRKISAEALVDLTNLQTLSSKCGQPNADAEAAKTWASFQSKFEGIIDGSVLGEPISVTLQAVDESFSDDSDAATAIAGKVERIYQWDYADINYKAPSAGPNIKTSGCAVITMAMAVRSYGVNLTARAAVADLAAFSLASGYRITGGTSELFFFKAAEKYGLKARTVIARDSNVDASWDKLVSTLKSGQVVAVSGTGARPFTGRGHYILFTGVDEKGDILLNDGRRGQSKPAYTAAELKPYVKAAIAIYK